MSNPLRANFNNNNTYNTNLFTSEKSNDSIVNGINYVVLNADNQLDTAREILSSVSINSDSIELNNESISIDFSSSAIQKSDDIGMKILEISNDSFDIHESIENICELLDKNYIFPEVAKKCTEYLLKNLKEGAYDEITDRTSFAEKLTEDLRSIFNDKHIGVRVLQNEFLQSEEDKINDLKEQRFGLLSRDQVISRPFYKELLSEDLADVGFLGCWAFEGVDEKDDNSDRYANAYKQTREFFLQEMKKIQKTNPSSVIIDLRGNCGGSAYGVQLLGSFFLPENIPLNTMVHRKKEDEEMAIIREFNTLSYQDLPKEKRLLNVPLYILVDHDTFSAGEEFANDMKALNKVNEIEAIIIGETTKGGANPGIMHKVNDDFTIFIPDKRAVNPYDRSNWEGTGVTPDFIISSDKALTKVISLKHHFSS
jgi:hypothetical protein